MNYLLSKDIKHVVPFILLLYLTFVFFISNLYKNNQKHADVYRYIQQNEQVPRLPELIYD